MINARNLAIAMVCGLLSVQFMYAQDLSRYREFQFGTNLPTVAEQAGMDPSVAKVIHQRPALIEELNRRRPLALSSSPRAEDPVWTTVFSFYEGQLFRIAVTYDPYKTEGMTAKDMIDAVSATYGSPTKPAAVITIHSSDGKHHGEVDIARWENSQYSFRLFRSAYQPGFEMIALSKGLDVLARAATIEAIRLDKEEAPQRELERKQKQDERNRASQQRSREVNKPNFRP